MKNSGDKKSNEEEDEYHDYDIEGSSDEEVKNVRGKNFNEKDHENDEYDTYEDLDYNIEGYDHIPRLKWSDIERSTKDIERSLDKELKESFKDVKRSLDEESKKAEAMKVLKKKLIGKTLPEAQKILNNEKIMNPIDESTRLMHVVAYLVDGVCKYHGQSKEFEMDVKVNNNRIVNIHSIKDGRHECDDTWMLSLIHI